MSPTRTAPGRAGRTCSRGSAQADPAVRARRVSASGSLSEEPEAATDVDRRRDAPRPALRTSAGRRWRGAVDNLPQRVQVAYAPPRRAGQGKEERIQETRPQETWRKGQHP